MLFCYKSGERVKLPNFDGPTATEMIKIPPRFIENIIMSVYLAGFMKTMLAVSARGSDLHFQSRLISKVGDIKT